MNQELSTALADLPGSSTAATKPSAAPSRKCGVGRHPDRIWIELKSVEWHSPTRIAEAKSANSEAQQRQHSPAQVPHSRLPKTPEYWLSVSQKMMDPNLTEEQTDAAFQKLPARAKAFAFWRKKNLVFVAIQRISVLCFHILRRGYLYSVAIQISPRGANRDQRYPIATRVGIRFRMSLFIKQMQFLNSNDSAFCRRSKRRLKVEATSQKQRARAKTNAGVAAHPDRAETSKFPIATRVGIRFRMSLFIRQMLFLNSNDLGIYPLA
jgi:hypothetical protein